MTRIDMIVAVAGAAITTIAGAQSPIYTNGLSRHHWCDVNQDDTVDNMDIGWYYLNFVGGSTTPNYTLESGTGGDIDMDGDVDTADYNLLVEMVTTDRLDEDHIAIYTTGVGHVNEQALDNLDSLRPIDKLNGKWFGSYKFFVFESVWDISSHPDTTAEPIASRETTPWTTYQAFAFDIKTAYEDYWWYQTIPSIEVGDVWVPVGVPVFDSNYDHIIHDTLSIAWLDKADNPWGMTDAELEDAFDDMVDDLGLSEPQLSDIGDAPTRADLDYYTSRQQHLVTAQYPADQILELDSTATTNAVLTYNTTTGVFDGPSGEGLVWIEEDSLADPLSSGGYVPSLGTDDIRTLFATPGIILVPIDQQPTRDEFPGLIPGERRDNVTKPDYPTAPTLPIDSPVVPITINTDPPANDPQPDIKTITPILIDQDDFLDLIGTDPKYPLLDPLLLQPSVDDVELWEELLRDLADHLRRRYPYDENFNYFSPDGISTIPPTGYCEDIEDRWPDNVPDGIDECDWLRFFALATNDVCYEEIFGHPDGWGWDTYCYTSE